MSSTARKVNLIANVTVITIAIIAGVIIAKRYLLATAPEASKNFTITEGQELPLLALDWSKNKQTLVVAFQKKGAGRLSASSEKNSRYKVISKRANIWLALENNKV